MATEPCAEVLAKKKPCNIPSRPKNVCSTVTDIPKARHDHVERHVNPNAVTLLAIPSKPVILCDSGICDLMATELSTCAQLSS